MLHAVYLCNRIVHSATNKTSYKMEQGVKPDFSKLRVFGCRVLCKILGKGSAKLEHHVYKGIFVGYGATDKHIWYVDSIASQDKIAVHVIFDKAHYTSKIRPPGPQLLYSICLPQQSEQEDKPPMQKSQEVYPMIPAATKKSNPDALITPLPLQ